MLRFVLGRLLQMIPVLLVIATLTFFMIRLAPGGPFDAEKSVSPEIRQNLERYYHMVNADGSPRSLWLQLGDYLGNLARGDLGPSSKYSSRTVNELIAESFPVSAELALWSLVIALAFGLPAGLVASLRPNSAGDYIPSSLAMVGISVPNFVIGPLLVLFFALKLQWVRVSGWDDWIDRILPSLTLGLLYAAYIARLTRGGMLEILSQDFIRTARAKGASNGRVIMKHALRGGLVPVVSYLGPAIAGLVTGSFVVESIFQIPGLGRYFVNAAFNRDYTMVLGAVLFYAALIVLFNLAVDILLIWMDPKQTFA
ncbi:MAG: ABC transporter permease subunit [Chthoniobacterales bacterium]|nr:ABC transporter permease subunit [Chthoniobacterales bacterium]